MELKNLRPAWAEVDLDAIAHNFGEVKRKIGRRRKVLVVVKANAYGHGAVAVSKTLARLGVDMLGVALLDEAAQLRRAGIQIPILLLGCLFPEEAAEALRLGVVPTVNTLEVGEELSRQARETGSRVKVHVRIDTGMGFTGVYYREAGKFIEQLAGLKGIEVEGAYTHFSAANKDRGFTELQIDRFRQVIAELKPAGMRIPIKHAANSAAIMDLAPSYFDMVRPGIMVYGLSPLERIPRDIQLKPAMSLKAKVVQLKRVPPGWSISYGRAYVAPRETILAVIPVGYADGYNRLLSNKGEVLIQGRRVPVVGRVCMDQFMVDVRDISEVAVGDEVVLYGRQEDEEVPVDEVAKKLNTINYEVTCWVSDRVPRVFIKGGQRFFEEEGF